MFQPIALETPGSINESATHLIEDLGRKIAGISNKEREGIFSVPMDWLSLLLQRFNAKLSLLRDSFAKGGAPGILVIPAVLTSKIK